MAWSKGKNSKQMPRLLIILVAVLAVVLLVAVIVAISLGGNRPAEPTEAKTQPQTQPQTQLPTQPEQQSSVLWFTPEEDVQCEGSSTLELQVAARQGSTVQAKLGSDTVELTASQEGSDLAEGYILYTGSLQIPTAEKEDKDLGKLTFTVTFQGETQTYTGGSVLCKKSAETGNQNPVVTPNDGKYIDVGSGYIVEIVAPAADTFYGDTRDDYSDPRNNYLPEGTVDYGSTSLVYDTTGKISYRLLRCGYRVYTQRKNYPATGPLPVVNCYAGTLPDHNEMGFGSLSVNGNFTVLTLDSMWKAPFYLNILPQTYNDTAKRDYTISKLTAEYVEITFCYTTKFTGTVQIPSNNPLFRSAELTQNKSDCTLRLYLKNKGVFYGWDSYYNDQDQLCFRFLNPVKAQKADNAFGADLSGIRIMIDVGHGGIDGGTSATSGGKTVLEAERNLALANLLKEDLESMGATVILNRTGNTNLTVDERIQKLKNEKPDLCISIHHNSYAPDSAVGGGEIIYFTPQSQKAASAIYSQVKDSGVYNKTRLKSGVYFLARESVCPVVLMECGYMTNAKDLAGCLDPDIMDQKAKDMAQGIANYFLNN